MRVYTGTESAEARIAAAWSAAVEGARDPAVIALAGACQRAARRRVVEGVYPLALAYLDASMRAVQSLPYTADPGGDALRDPVETIAEGGDCEDKAALFASLVLVGARLFALPVSVRLVWVVQRGWPDDHASAWTSAGAVPLQGSGVIAQGDEPPAGVWWAETTVAAARGESPYRAVRRLGAGHDRIAGNRA